jgi:hypothetical protein
MKNMLNWLQRPKSEVLEQAQARSRERARQPAGEAPESFALPSDEGLIVEEISPEEFMRFLRHEDGKPV